MPNPLEPFYNAIALARLRNGRAMLASSYDRRGGNHDWSNYIRREGSAAVLMEAEGPGCITRIWTADPQKGTVRIYIDDLDAPILEAPLRELFGRLPLSLGIGGEAPEVYERSRAERLPMGHTSYCPLPFAKRCKITIDPEDSYLYYQINYDLYPPETEVRSFDPACPGDAEAVRKTAEVWGDRGLLTPAQSVQCLSIEPESSAVVYSAEGDGVITELQIELTDLMDARSLRHMLDNVWLTAHFDDDEPRDPSVRAPLGPLFLDFGAENPPRTVMVGTSEKGVFYLKFPMPYYEKAELRLHNRSLLPLKHVNVAIVHRPAPEPGLYRFRATWHVETPFGPDHRDYGGVACRLLNLDGRDNYEILNFRGAGHFVGCGIHADMRDSPTDRACGEGDEMFFIDDDPRLTLYGTGAEDYINDAWGVRGYDGPVSGDGLSGTWGVHPQLFLYRLHLSDSVPFYRHGRFTLEHGTGNNCSGSYRSIAYWYMDPASARTRAEERRWEEIRDNTP